MTKTTRKTNPASLEALACNVSFNEMLGNLMLCPEHLPVGKRMPWMSFSSVMTTNPYFSSEKARSLVRQKLDHFLVGTMSDKIREIYVKKFYTRVLQYQRKLDAIKHATYSDSSSSSEASDYSEDEAESEPEEEECITDIWVLLDCVLDDTFQELTTHVALPGTKPNLKLMSTIIEHSPDLEKLTLDFQLAKKDRDGAVMGDLKQFFTSFNSLPFLTTLVLDNFHDTSRNPIALSCLATSCPSLSHLTLSQCHFTKRGVLALIVGELVNDLLPTLKEPDWSKRSAFGRLVVPSGLLSPLCSSLKELKVIECFTDCDGDFDQLPAPIAAFTLRHFQLLQKMEDPVFTNLGIKLLHDYDSGQVSKQSEFEKPCLEADAGRQQASPSPLVDLLEPKNVTFSGHLSLTELDNVNVLARDLLRTIGSSCPFLRKASFFQNRNWIGYLDGNTSYWNGLANLALKPHEQTASHEELETILNGWTKVTTIEIDASVSSNYVKTILKVFGSELLHLKLNGCGFFVSDLAHAHQLKSLSMNGCKLFGSKEDRLSAAAHHFLPELKIFESDSCLGSWSHIFEEKSSLVQLKLACCHIGVESSNEGCDARPSKRFKSSGEANISQAKWLYIHERWKNLEILEISKCGGLRIPMVYNLVSQLPKLKTIFLPYQVKSTDFDSSYSVIKKLSNRIPPVELTFGDSRSYVKYCPIVDATLGSESDS